MLLPETLEMLANNLSEENELKTQFILNPSADLYERMQELKEEYLEIKDRLDMFIP